MYIIAYHVDRKQWYTKVELQTREKKGTIKLSELDVSKQSMKLSELDVSKQSMKLSELDEISMQCENDAETTLYGRRGITRSIN